MAPRSSTLAWKIPWTAEPGRLPSMGSLRVGHNWMTSLSLFPFTHWRRKWRPTPVFLPRESQGWGSLVGFRLWVAQSQTQLKWLSSSSSYCLIPGGKGSGSWPLPLRSLVGLCAYISTFTPVICSTCWGCQINWPCLVIYKISDYTISPVE